MFRFTIKPSSGSHIQCLAKITYLVPMYQYWCQCYGGICSHKTDVNNDTQIGTNIGTRYVILAKHWTWFPDDGFIVNRNMLEQLL
jgi:hypothetical protein